MTAYRDNYQRIAADHIAHWSTWGENPWQSPEHMEAVGAPTAALIEKYAGGGTVLDAGCGMGELLLRVPSITRHGVDFATGYVAIACDRGIEAVEADLEDLPYPDGMFDVVAAVDVLEHVIDLNAVLREVLRVLRPEGVLVVRVPDREDLWTYLDPGYPYRFAHLRSFDEPSLRLLVDRVCDCDLLDFGIVNREAILAARKR